MSRLAAYLARLGLDDAPAPDAAGLAMLQRAHRQSIGFENFDSHLAARVAIDADSVFAKLVEGRRGGYCFEHNRLFADMLRELGFAPRPLLARVWLGLDPARDAVPPRTHTLLLVDLDGAPWIADAGFGGSFVPPMPLADGTCASTPDSARHRLVHSPHAWGEWLLERAGPPGATDGRAAPHRDWQPQYGFCLTPVAPDDLELANHWTATRPGIRFTTLRIASIVLADGFAALSDTRLTLFRAGTTETREITDAEAYRAVLAELFRIELSAGAVAALGLF